MPIDPRAAVLIGVGVAHGTGDEEAYQLMARATTTAAEDAGVPGMLGAVEHISVPRGTWSYPDPGRLVAGEIGATHARTAVYELGIPQQTLVSTALSRIRSGQLDVALVVGGEAKRRAALASRRGDTANDTDQGAARPDEHHAPEGEIVAPAEVALGLVAPVQQYAMIDNALRHAEGCSIDQHLDQLARLLAGFQRVASSNPEAAFPESRTEAFLRQPGPGNRPLAFPYAKWHSTQWTVDQAAALLLCSVEAARAHGVSPDRWLFPHVALESSYALPLSGRAELHRWPAMAILGEAAAEYIGRPLSTIEHVDLYSCFPAAVRVQQRELGLPLDGVPTVTGGMAFAGGPLNNYTYQSTAAVAGCLRQSPESLGMVSTVSGLLTKPGIAVWSATPPTVPPLIADLAADASAATARVQVVDDYRGPARVATYTVTYADDDPRQVWTIADTVDGRRCLAVCADPEVAKRATREELIGHAITVGGRVFEMES